MARGSAGLLILFLALAAAGAALVAPQAPGGGGREPSTPGCTDTWRGFVEVPEDPDPPGRNDYDILLHAVVEGCDIMDVVAVVDYAPSIPHAAALGAPRLYWVVSVGGKPVFEGWAGETLNAPDDQVAGKTVYVIVSFREVSAAGG